jgi:hypothetical protein
MEVRLYRQDDGRFTALLRFRRDTGMKPIRILDLAKGDITGALTFPAEREETIKRAIEAAKEESPGP